MSVHYKFKSDRSNDTIAFDGLHISVRDLKKAIFHQKKIGKSTDFDLQITNAHTNEVYIDDNALIPKNSSLVVSRIPLTAQQKKAWEKSAAAQLHLINLNKGDSPEHHSINNKYSKSADLVSADLSEGDKIQAAIDQSTHAYDPSHYVKIKNSNQVGEVPPSYRCYKCMQPGHWIKDCKLNSTQDATVEIRKSTGIPRSFMIPVEGPQVPGAMMTPMGHFAVPAIDHEARRELPKKASEPAILEKPAIPEDIVCGVCKDLLTDAVMIPCCGNSFCDECIRNVLLESEDHQCPDCKEKDVSPDTLIPSRFLRNCVNNFRNQTGYTRTTPSVSVHTQPPPVVSSGGQQPPLGGSIPPNGNPGQSVIPSLMHTGGPPLGQPGMPPPGLPGGPPLTHPPPGHPGGPPLGGMLSHVQPGSLPHSQTGMPPHVSGGPPPAQSSVPGSLPPRSVSQPQGPTGQSQAHTNGAPIRHIPPLIPPHLQPFRPSSSGSSKPGITSSNQGVSTHHPLDKSRLVLSPSQPITIEDGEDEEDNPKSPTAHYGGVPTSHIGSHSTFTPSYRGRGRGDYNYSRGRGYLGTNIRPLMPLTQTSGHQSVAPPPHLHFTQGGGYVFQPVTSGSYRSDGGSDSRDFYKGRPRPLDTIIPANGDPLEIFEKLMKEKDNRKKERARSRSRSYSRSWSRSPRRSPQRSRSPSLKRRSPKLRSRSRSPILKRSPPLKRSPLPKRSPPKSKLMSRPRSRTPTKRSLSRSRSRSRSPFQKKRSRSPSKPYSYSRTYYGDRKYKPETRPYQYGNKPIVRSSVYKTHDYGTSHEHSRYGDKYERDYGPPPSRNYPPKPPYYDLNDRDSKRADSWEHVRDNELEIRRKEMKIEAERPIYERERALSANRIIQDMHERDKEKDRIHEREIVPLIHFNERSPESVKGRSPEKERKSKRDKKKKRDDSERKKKKKRSKEKKIVEEEEEDEEEDPAPLGIASGEAKPHPESENLQGKEELNKNISQSQTSILPEEKKPKKELFNADDLYKDLGAAVDMKPFENEKEVEDSKKEIEKSEKEVEHPIKEVDVPAKEVKVLTEENVTGTSEPVDKVPEKDVMLAPVPELSKWEKDDDILMNQNDTRPLELELTLDPSDRILDESDDHDQQVTFEVIKRAENAIFKKGVNPIKDAAKPPEKKEKKDKEEKKEEKKDSEDKKPREDKREREREDKREDREMRKDIDKRERLLHKEPPIHVEPYYKDMYPPKDLKPVKSIAMPVKAPPDLDDNFRRRKGDRIVFPEKERRISAKERLGAKIDDKGFRREIKYNKILKSDQEVVAKVIHGDHHSHRERKVLSLKEEGKKRKALMEGYVHEISDEDRTERLTESSLRRSENEDMLPPYKKKPKHSPAQEESSDEGSSDESVESPKKQKKKKKSKKRKKEKKKKSKSKHESSSDSGSSSSSSDSESDDDAKKKKKHKHKSRKKSKKHKKSKK